MSRRISWRINRRISWRRAAVSVAVSAAVGMGMGCGGGGDGGTEPPPQTPAITLALSGSSASVVQGGSGTVTVTIARSGGFTGPVSLTLDGAPANVTGTFQPATIAASQTTSTLTLNAAATAAAGQASLTVRATGSGVEARTAPIALTVTAAAMPDFTIAASPATIAVQQGKTATSTVNITRTGGFTGSVALAVSGAPAGVTATLASASTTQGSVGITVAASAGAAVGSHTLTITGTGTGVTGNRTATLGVTVSAGDGGNPSGSIAWKFCGPDAPIWFAVQDGTGAWKRVTGTNDEYRFDISSGKGGVAYVQGEAGGSYNTMVQYGTAEELKAMGLERCVSDTRKTVNGSVAGLGMTDMATINLGGAAGSASGAKTTFTIQNVPGGPRDLIATRTKLDISGGGVTMAPDRMIIRRGVDAPAGSTLPVLDFGGSEAFAPETRNLSVLGGNGESLLLTEMYTTSNATGALLHVETTPSAAATRTFYGVPAAKQESGDLHMLVVAAYPGSITDPTAATHVRSAILTFKAAADKTVSLGPDLVMPTLSVVGPGHYRVQIAKQAEYDRFWTASFAGRALDGGTGNTATVSATAGYVGASGTVEMDLPEFTSVNGWSTAWLPSGSIYWQTSASGWEGGSFTQPMQDGAVIRTAMRSGTVAAF